MAKGLCCDSQATLNNFSQSVSLSKRQQSFSHGGSQIDNARDGDEEWAAVLGHGVGRDGGGAGHGRVGTAGQSSGTEPDRLHRPGPTRRTELGSGRLGLDKQTGLDTG